MPEEKEQRGKRELYRDRRERESGWN